MDTTRAHLIGARVDVLDTVATIVDSTFLRKQRNE